MKTYYFKYNNNYVLLTQKEITQILGEKFKYKSDYIYCLNDEINKSITNNANKKNV